MYRSVCKANYLQMRPVSHRTRVMNLYKNVLRDIEAKQHPDRVEARYQMVLMRQEFEKNKDIRDIRIAKRMVEEAEERLFREGHCQPIKFPYSPGGVCFERYSEPDDFVLDFWHPLEKARYPFYFARREQLKQEYIKLYESDYGNALEVIGIKKHQDYTIEFRPDHKIEELEPERKEFKQIESKEAQSNVQMKQ